MSRDRYISDSERLITAGADPEGVSVSDIVEVAVPVAAAGTCAVLGYCLSASRPTESLVFFIFSGLFSIPAVFSGHDVVSYHFKQRPGAVSHPGFSFRHRLKRCVYRRR